MGLSKYLPKFSLKIWIYAGFYISMTFVVYMYIIENILNLAGNLGHIKHRARLQRQGPTPGIKYTLLWTDNYEILYRNKNKFERLNCAFSNCEFTQDRYMFGDYSSFDAIMFSEKYLSSTKDRPTKRRSHQLYVFTTIESHVSEPACELHNDGFYNWTFTHRLDSDVVWKYFVVSNTSGSIVAPSTSVDWRKAKLPVSPKIKELFKGRRKAAAWIVSHCNANSQRDDYLSKLKEHLYHYSLQLDVYGTCTGIQCLNKNCDKMLRENYYFYMSFENSFAEDYVTEKVLHGYNNLVVPVVYGGADYDRFLPKNSYINARLYHPYHLAKLIHRAVTNPEEYLSYFHWTNFYSIDSKPEVYHPLCDYCEALNSERAKHAPVIQNFRLWWNTLNGTKWCLPEEFWEESLKVNFDANLIYGFDIY